MTRGPITWYRGGSSPGGSSGNLCTIWQAGPIATIPGQKSHQPREIATSERWGWGASRGPRTKGKTAVLGRRSLLERLSGRPRDYFHPAPTDLTSSTLRPIRRDHKATAHRTFTCSHAGYYNTDPWVAHGLHVGCAWVVHGLPC